MILNSPYITGSITVTGNANVQGTLTVTGSLSGTATSASLALNSNLLQGTGSVGFSTTASLLAVSSSQQQISSSLLQVSASYISLSGSYNTFSGSASTRTTQIENVYATTGSNSFRANQSITGSLVVSSTITAQTLVVQTVTSSILYSSGSNLFGSALSNTQTFTGSVNITGSMSVTGSAAFSSDIILPYSKALAFNSISNQYITADSSNLYLGTANLARLTISSSGAATIAGALTIQAGTGLTKYYLTSAGSGDALNQFYDNTGTVKIQLYTNGNSYFTGGSVGIGTTSPNTKLEVYSSTAATATIGRFGAANYNYPSNKTYIQIGTQYEDGSSKIGSSNPSGNLSELFFETCTATSGVFAERMRINSNGNVGIGSTSPARKLIIYGGTTNAGLEILSANGYRTAIIAGVGSSGTGADQGYFQMTDQGTAKVVLNTAGDSYIAGGSLGIGTSSPLATLSTYGGAVQFMGDYRNYQTIIKNAGGNGTFNGSLLITIPQMSDGNVDGYGGYSCEVYVAGYSGFYCHAWFSGYVNGSLTPSEAIILRSNGGWSISQTSYGANNQGFQFTIDYPSSIVHPTARIIFNKGGSPNSAQYPANTITSAFS